MSEWEQVLTFKKKHDVEAKLWPNVCLDFFPAVSFTLCNVVFKNEMCNFIIQIPAQLGMCLWPWSYSNTMLKKLIFVWIFSAVTSTRCSVVLKTRCAVSPARFRPNFECVFRPSSYSKVYTKMGSFIQMKRLCLSVKMIHYPFHKLLIILSNKAERTRS